MIKRIRKVVSFTRLFFKFFYWWEKAKSIDEMENVKETLKFRGLTSRNFYLADVGARDGIGIPWDAYREMISQISFEPDPEEYSLLLNDKREGDAIFNYALAEKDVDRTLFLTKNRGCSSLYEPNLSFLDSFPEYERFLVDEKINIQTTALDHIEGIPGLDFLKIDVQGAELEVLKGARKTISQAFGLEVEVEFQEMYKGQPLFSEVDAYIRNELGFTLYDLRKTYWKHSEGIGIGGLKGQLIFGDALYLRSVSEVGQWVMQFDTEERRNKLLFTFFGAIVYGYHEYCLQLLKEEAIIHLLRDEQLTQSIQEILEKTSSSIYYEGGDKILLSWITSIINGVSRPSHGNWATTGNHLGMRRNEGTYI